MPIINFSIDLHAHPNYKAFARAFRDDSDAPDAQSTSPSHPNSLWFYNPPSIVDKAINKMLGVTKFSQANLTAALYGRVMVIVVGLGTTEKYFFRPKGGDDLIEDLVVDFASGFKMPRINALQAMQDYWPDFMQENDYLLEMHNKPVRIDGHWYAYRWVNHFEELAACRVQNEHDMAGQKKDHPLVVALIPSIEGLHVLGTGTERSFEEEEIIQRTLLLKQLPNAPWFVTFSHHFYNHLCGHARSLRGVIGKMANQEEGINAGFTPLGLKVLRLLLDETQGRRILIDIKHMSAEARKAFIQMRRHEYSESFPIIISHGVANGLPQLGATVSQFPQLGNQFIQALEDEVGGDGAFKDHNLINFFDEEIIEMVKSNGIMGLQLDERRLANDPTIKGTKDPIWRHKAMHYRSELLWKQIQYIGELLDANNMYAWGHLAIGSDYDGIVDPLNSFWTMEQYDELAGYLERHAYNYFDKQSSRLRNGFNIIGPDQLIQQIFCDNAWNFFKRWF